MSKHYHLCISFEGAIEHFDCMTIIEENGKERPAKLEEIEDAIKDAKSKGYIVIPPCDNVDERGYCMGHDEIAKE